MPTNYTLHKLASEAAKGQTCLVVTAKTEQSCQEGIWSLEDQHPRVNWLGPVKTTLGEWTAYGRTFGLILAGAAFLFSGTMSYSAPRMMQVRNPVAGTAKSVPLPKPRPPVNDANGNAVKR